MALTDRGGEGYSAEEQITGEAAWGGLKISVTPLKADLWKILKEEQDRALKNRDPYVCYSLRPPEAMGLAAGGKMRQEIYPDQYGADAWDVDATDRVFVTLVHAKDWKSISGLDHVNVGHRPRLLSDNGSSYISADLAEWLEDKKISHIRGVPYHLLTQGKIERWHQTLKNRVLLNNYCPPRELEAEIAAFVEDYNHRRLHESLNNLTPADVYFGRGPAILEKRKRLKKLTIQNRRLQHQLKAA